MCSVKFEFSQKAALKDLEGRRFPTPGLPSITVPPASKWEHLAGVMLADPELSIPGSVDILLGTDFSGRLMQTGRVIGRHGSSVCLLQMHY
jgi:hypothetical protein